MTSEILECTDCSEHFCAACDDGFTHCPDCGGALCGECAELSLDLRQCRCLTCCDDDLTGVQFKYEGDVRKLYKHYSEVVTGKRN